MEAFGVPANELAETRAALAARADAAVCRVWPENWRAVRIFIAMGTQWNMLAGPSAIMWVGLRYEVLDMVEARMPATLGVTDPDRDTVFAQLRAMERIALEVLRSKS